MRNQDKYNINNVKELLLKENLTVLDKEYIDVRSKILCKDKDGYYVYIVLSNYLNRHGIGRKYDKSNDKSIININNYLSRNNVHFKCISEKYVSANSNLLFECTKCGRKINMPWRNVNKNDNKSRNHIVCKNCDGSLESLHAMALKQMFLYYYPDTCIEDKTYRSPLTGKICPTDIVNHNLKIAIEIQSQWHDYENIKIKDRMKKEFWVSQEYKFYALDIRDYSILEMCQIFFKINSLPEWIDYDYSNKLNIDIVQNRLNKGLTVIEIAKEININKHRIYDAIHAKKLYYPHNYKNNTIKKEYVKNTLESSETAVAIMVT